MPLISTSYASDSIERLNMATIIKRYLRTSGLGFSGTVDSGDDDYIVDSSRMRSNGPKDQVSGWVYILKDAGGSAAAPEGEILSVHHMDPTEAKATVNGRFTADPASADEYGVFWFVHPQDVVDHLNELITTDLYWPSWAMLTEVDDGDMENSNTTSWTASNATLAKATTGTVMHGARWLSVTATAANAYAKTATDISVRSNEPMHASATVYTDGSTNATLQIYDVTNGAEIASVSTSSTTPIILWKDFTTPATCKKISLRLTTVTDAQVTYWDDVTLFAYNSTELPTPRWVRDSDNIKGVYELRPYQIDGDEWDATFRGDRDTRWDFRDEGFGLRPPRLVARYGTIRYPLFIKGTRNEVAFSSLNSDYKNLDPQLINAGLCFKVFSQLYSYRWSGSLNMDWVNSQRSRWEKEYTSLRRNHILRIEAEESAPEPSQRFYRGRDDFYTPGERRVR